MSASPTHMIDDRKARRNAVVLAVAQALSGMAAAVIMTLGAIVGQMLSIDKSLATLPVTAFVVGTALTTIPASFYMQRVGRRFGFMTGAALSFCGSILAVYAIFVGNFWIFCAGTALSGMYAAFAAYYRFAAADTASIAFKGNAISWVLAGGVVAAILGPQMVIYTQGLFDPFSYAGSFAAAAGLAILVALVVSFVDVPIPQRRQGRRDTGRPLGQIMRQPRFMVAVACAMVSYGIMSLIMTATPLAVMACSYSVSDAAFIIQWHIFAMFAPSFFTGHLINRFGQERVVFTGLVLLAGCGVVSLMGVDLAHFWVALVLLGVGWNFGFIGATSMVVDCHDDKERAKVQAANDFLVFALVATASFTSGKLMHLFGWSAVNLAVFPFLAIAAMLLLWLYFHREPEALPRG